MVNPTALGTFFFVLACMFFFIRAGRRIAIWQQTNRPEETRGGTVTADGAIFGLMGLLLAFMFSGASSRFEARRSLIADEANAIGTAYLRLDLLPADAQPPLRENFRRYVRSRIAVYEKLPDVAAVRAALAESGVIQNEIWIETVVAAQETGSAAVVNLTLSSLNTMIDITTTRVVALQAHPPVSILVMLIVTVLMSSLLLGYNMTLGGSPSVIHTVIFVLLVGVATYVILDYEYPRAGMIRIDAVDAVLVETLEKMK